MGMESNSGPDLRVLVVLDGDSIVVTEGRSPEIISPPVSPTLKIGEPDGIRTHDPLIKSQVLYRLSYGLLQRHMGPLIQQGQYCAAFDCRGSRAAYAFSKVRADLPADGRGIVT